MVQKNKYNQIKMNKKKKGIVKERKHKIRGSHESSKQIKNGQIPWNRSRSEMIKYLGDEGIKVMRVIINLA